MTLLQRAVAIMPCPVAPGPNSYSAMGCSVVMTVWSVRLEPYSYGIIEHSNASLLRSNRARTRSLALHASNNPGAIASN